MEDICTNHEFKLKVRGVKLRRRRPLNPIKAASFMILAESNAVTTRKPKKLPAIVDHDQLLRSKGSKATSADPMVKCMRELKDLRKAKVEDLLKKVCLLARAIYFPYDKRPLKLAD